MAAAHALALLVALLLAGEWAVAASRAPQNPAIQASTGSLDKRKKKKHKHPYTSPLGLFIQERASKQLPGPGQHFSFGSLKPWEEILGMLDNSRKDRKLLLVVRHGQAISNFLSDTLGPDEWFAVEGTCKYDDKAGNVYNIFDADLTGLGMDQAKSLNSMLHGGGWFDKVAGGKPVRAVISPLTRCLHTATLVLDGLQINATNVEEFVRETLGEDTCDARRSVSDPTDDDDKRGKEGPCGFEHGLSSTYPQYKYRVYDAKADADRGFGLLGDTDHLWTKDERERQKHQVRRAKKFLDILFEHAPEPVVVVVTHSGFTRSILLAVQREPYRPQNAELVPVIVDKTRRGEWAEEDEEAWIEGVIAAATRHQEQEEQEQLTSPEGGHMQHRQPCMFTRLVQQLWQRWTQHRA